MVPINFRLDAHGPTIEPNMIPASVAMIIHVVSDSFFVLIFSPPACVTHYTISLQVPGSCTHLCAGTDVYRPLPTVIIHKKMVTSGSHPAEMVFSFLLCCPGLLRPARHVC